ncbi:MAG: RNA-binding protein [Nanoarchaeota archaeon]|nr:RNA-binding protein [Nanoarchaeota archaeon]
MKLYVGNLPFSVTEEAFKKAFSEFGEISEATIIVDKFSKRSKGFGFVTFSDDEAGKKAIAEMNEKDLEGRPLKVSEAKPREEGDRPPRRDFNNRGSGNRGFGNRDSRPRRY